MSSQRKGSNSGMPQSPAIDPEAVKQFLKVQTLQAQNDAKELEIRTKEADNNYKYAQRSLELQAEHLKMRPIEGRKTFQMMGNYLIGFFLLVLVFCGFCLYMGEKEFLLDFLKISGYFFTSALGYFIGRRQAKVRPREENNQAEVLD